MYRYCQLIPCWIFLGYSIRLKCSSINLQTTSWIGLSYCYQLNRRTHPQHCLEVFLFLKNTVHERRHTVSFRGKWVNTRKSLGGFVCIQSADKGNRNLLFRHQINLLEYIFWSLRLWETTYKRFSRDQSLKLATDHRNLHVLVNSISLISHVF